MRRIPTSALCPGLKVGRPVYNSNGHILLNTGVILNDHYIGRLKELNIPALYIDDQFLSDIIISDIISEDTRLCAIQQVKIMLTEQTQNRPNVGKALIGVKDMVTTVNQIIDEIISNPNVMLNLIDVRCLDEYTFGHSVNVCVLSILTGITLGYCRTKLFQLGMGALLHDVGKVRIPESILNKPGTLLPEEFEEIKKHCQYGFEILCNDSHASRLCTMVALQHHERYGGQGYPNGLKGDEIHEFSAITGLVDMYDALTADRVYRKSYPPHEAYEMVSGSGNFLFDFKIVQAFLQNVAVYPSGTFIKLNNGNIGVVVETKKGFSMYPKIRLLFNYNFQPLPNIRDVWLADEQDLAIMGVLDDETVNQRCHQFLSDQ